MALNIKARPLVTKGTPTPPGIGNAARALRDSRAPFAEDVARGLEALQSSLDSVNRTLRNTSPDIHEVTVTDSTGRVVGSIGPLEVSGVQTSGGYFAELYAGDPYGTSDPSDAILSVTPDGAVTIGQNGFVRVLDPFGSDAAWIGCQFDTQVVTGAANNGAGLIRLTVVAHTLSTGDIVQVRAVGGVVNATGGIAQGAGVFMVTKITANTFDLQNSVWAGAYTSRGTVDRLLHISGVANNGAGLARITTVVAHTYESGDRVNLQGVGSGLNAQWTITVIDATHFDLVGSTFTGGTNGTCLRFFAGGLFQTIAIGPSFADYRLRAFADGSLRMAGAEIVLDGANATITLDPTLGEISVVGKGAFPTNVQITSQSDPVSGAPAGVLIQRPSSPTANFLSLAYGFITMYRDAGFGVQASFYVDPSQLLLKDIHGTTTVEMDSASGIATFAGTVDAAFGFKKNGVSGLTVARSFGTSLTVSTAANGVVGTPGVGQANATVVTGVTLNLTANQFTGGIITA